MKTFTNFTIAVLVVLGTALTVSADWVGEKSLTTLEGYATFSSYLDEQNSDSLKGNWSVAPLFTYKVNQDKSYDTSAVVRSVLNYFGEGKTTQEAAGSTKNNRKVKEGGDIEYGDVKQIAAKDLTTTNGAGKHLDWLTPQTGTNGKGEGLNGFYAFKYTFNLEAINDVNNYDDLKVILNLNFGSDDHIEAVYLNGVSIQEYLSGYGTENWQEATSLYVNYDASEMAASGGIFAEGNELVFIVHNDGHNGQASGFKDGSNALGFGGDGFIAISANKDFDPEDFVPTPPIEITVTPEPATMLLFGLGIAGLGLARRTRK
ncbi:hypothetical protein FACS189419_07170 [Planctomycetales bacterium]|nr:hypothetical protein FACS189419_07170 [Planctomycetales bacterium]